MSRRARERHQQEEFEQRNWKDQRDEELDTPDDVQYPEDDSDQGYKPETFR